MIYNKVLVLAFAATIAHCQICLPETLVFRTADGTCNSQTIPSLGAFRDIQTRAVPANYADGVGEIDQALPSARQVSNAICDQGDTPPGNDRESSLMLIYFGQFVDHDITLIELSNENEDIEVPENDPVFTEPLEFRRSEFVPGQGGVRGFENLNTAWLDLSNIYGDTLDRSNALRELDGSGLMKTSQFFDQEYLPLNRNVRIPTAEDDLSVVFTNK